VAREAAANAAAAIAAAYARASGHSATVLPCDLADGALARSGFVP
jgi:hypothetical protein